MSTAPGESIAINLRVAKAMGLTRQGKVKEAEALLAGDRTIPEDDLSLEFLASLATAQGDYLRALRLWEQLLQRAPEHANARKMIDAIELWLSRPSWAKYVPYAGIAAAALIVAGIFWSVASDSSVPPPRPAKSAVGSPLGVSPGSTSASSPIYTPPPRPAPSAPTPVVSFPSPKTQRPSGR